MNGLRCPRYHVNLHGACVLGTQKAAVDCRGADDTGDRSAVLDQSNIDGELVPLVDELPGAVNRVNQEKQPACNIQTVGGSTFFGNHGNIGKGCFQHIAKIGIDLKIGPIDAPYLQLISYIVVIASTVQLVEMFIKKMSPALFRSLGIFLPLITTNCAILGLALFQTNRGYSFIQCLVYALGAGLGFALAILLLAGVREKLELANLPDIARGTALTLIVAGILSLAFMGFAGMGG